MTEPKVLRPLIDTRNTSKLINNTLTYFKDFIGNSCYVRTLFTGADRHNYVDPDYAYTEVEREQIELHKSIYKKYLDDLRFCREEKKRSK